MKVKYTFIFILISAILYSSCGDKKEEQNVSQPEVKTEVVNYDTIVEEPVIEEVIEEPVPEWPKQVVVQKGEWIYDIARREYGSAFAWRKIYNANQDKIANPDIIYPGQVLVLPE